MTHEFSADPIKLRIVDIKTGKLDDSLVFVGRVPHDVAAHLKKIEKDTNFNSLVLKKFYGPSWRDRLGINVKKTGGMVGTSVVTDKVNKYDSSYNTDISVTTSNPNYNPSSMIGIDPVLNDIVFSPDEIPLIRGGWYDRNGVYYSDGIDSTGLKSVNIISKGKIDTKNRPI